MNQRQLQYFLEVFEKKSITKAASELFITPQGLSKTINALEEELGVELFIHKGNRIIPTEDAARLSYHARNLLMEYNIITERLFTKYDSKKSIRIACAYDSPLMIPTGFIAKFIEKYPQIRVDIKEYPDNEILKMVQDKTVELAILPGPLDNQKYDLFQIMTDSFCIVVNENNELAKYDRISLELLKGFPLAVKDMSTQISICQYSELFRKNAQPQIVLECSDSHLLHKMVIEDHCVCMSLMYLAKKIQSDKIKILPFEEDWVVKTLYFLNEKDTILSYEATLFKEEFINYFEDHRDEFNVLV